MGGPSRGSGGRTGETDESDDRYAAALSYLYGLANWRRPQDRATRERQLVARPAALLARLGDPQRHYRTILVAGTKGKGSTAATLASIIGAAGQRVGFYSQPHLHSYRERIRVDGVLISKGDIVAGVGRLAPQVAALEAERPDLGEHTTFEVGTALALDHFARSGVALAVLEVGLGGRLDTTNAVAADLAVITSISFDHMAILGDTLPQIATEKAGIIKPGRPVLAAPQRPAALAPIERTAAERGAPLGIGGRDWWWAGDEDALTVAAVEPRPGLWAAAWRHDALRPALRGAHQLENVATALAAAETLAASGLLALGPGVVAAGVAATRWPARLETVRPRGPGGPLVVIDGAHNGDSAEKLAAALRSRFAPGWLWLVLGAGLDHDLAAIVAPLAPLAAGAWATAARHPRSRGATEVAEALAAAGVRAIPAHDTAAALAAALDTAAPGDLICVAGSLFVAAEAREALGLVPPEEIDPSVAMPPP